MNKEQWLVIYNNLDNLLKEYNEAHYKFRNGRNKKIRGEGERKLDILLDRARHIIFQSTHLKDLFDEEIKESRAAEVFFIDEFFDWNYFHKDMPLFLERIRNHIAQME